MTTPPATRVTREDVLAAARKRWPKHDLRIFMLRSPPPRECVLHVSPRRRRAIADVVLSADTLAELLRKVEGE